MAYYLLNGEMCLSKCNTSKKRTIAFSSKLTDFRMNSLRSSTKEILSPVIPIIATATTKLRQLEGLLTDK